MPKNTFRPLIWCEAIIGCGKTSFCRQIGKRLNLRVMEEPVGNGEGGENKILPLFYADQKRHAFALQMSMLSKRFAMQQEASYACLGYTGTDGVILDRSIAGDRVFAKMHMEAGNIEPEHWEVYEEHYEVMARTLIPPTLLIYLDCQPETAYERMKKRGRGMEAGVPIEYLARLRQGYQDLIAEAKSRMTPWGHQIEVMTLAYDYDTVTDLQWDRLAQTIKDACYRT